MDRGRAGCDASLLCGNQPAGCLSGWALIHRQSEERGLKDHIQFWPQCNTCQPCSPGSHPLPSHSSYFYNRLQCKYDFMLWDSECVSMHNRWDELREHGSWSTSGIYGGVRCVKWRMGCHTDVVVNTLVPCQQAQMTDTACLLRASCFKRRSSLRACSVWHFFFF